MSHVNNILRVFHQATADDIHHGLTWYGTARDEAREMHDNLSLSAGVIAALSPGMRWEFNILAAHALIAGESIDGYAVRWYANVRKAKRIIKGESPFDVLRGPKVRAFYQCIMNPLDREPVCIDSHAYSIWLGHRIVSADVPLLTRHKRYETIADHYREAAHVVSSVPSQMQAITWVTWRRIHAKEMKISVAPF